MMNYESMWDAWADRDGFSGVFSVTGPQGLVFERCCGQRNRAEGLDNQADTAFGIASGTKLLTGLAVCKLAAAGKVALDGLVWDILPQDLGCIDRRVTVRHLLTHTSGIGDYLDEEEEDAAATELAMTEKYPVYLWERLDYYLQMITPLPPKFAPGARFGYNNAGFVLLGLVVEAAAGMPYQQYVTEAIVRPLGLAHTGFYRMDDLPANTALGYLEDGRANIFRLPVIGGSDGGLFTCAADMDTLWRAILAGRVLPEGMLAEFLKCQVARGGARSYGLGVYRYEKGGDTAYYAVGGDFGVAFFSAHLPRQGITATALANTEANIFPLLDQMLEALPG